MRACDDASIGLVVQHSPYVTSVSDMAVSYVVCMYHNNL